MAENKVIVAKQLLDSVKDNLTLLDVPEIKDNWIQTYRMTSGKDDGELKYEAEKLLFAKAISESWSLQQCTRASMYSAWIELGVSGLTLRDGISYIIPYSKEAVWMAGWKGRLEQITEMKNVVHVRQPQVVYENDKYELVLGEKATIKDHKRATGEKGKIVLVYVFIQFTHGVEFYYMERDEVLSIRDRFSQSYNSYISDCNAAKKSIGETFFVTKRKKDGSTYQAKVEPPMWVSDEQQAFKKTLIKRVYSELPKLPKHKYLDSKIKVLEDRVDIDEVDEKSFAQFTEVVDTETGEVSNAGSPQPQPQQPAQQPQPEQKQPVQPVQPSATTGTAPQNQSIQDAIVVTEDPELNKLAEDTSTGF